MQQTHRQITNLQNPAMHCLECVFVLLQIDFRRKTDFNCLLLPIATQPNQYFSFPFKILMYAIEWPIHYDRNGYSKWLVR